MAGCGRSELELQALKQRLPEAYLSRVDLCNAMEIQEWISGLKWKHIDLLVVCSGLMPPSGKLWEIPAEEWRRACEVNIEGLVKLLSCTVPLLKDGSRMVLFSSRYGRTVAAGMGCYSATKWAIESMAKTLALELPGVIVVSLDPGIVNTEMLQESGDRQFAEAQPSIQDFAERTGPFLLSLSISDTGRNLTAPGSPEAYFHLGQAYKDRPAWASGFTSCCVQRCFFVDSDSTEVMDIIRKAVPGATCELPRGSLQEMVEQLKCCDVLVAAVTPRQTLELWEGRKAGLKVFSIGEDPHHLADHNFKDVADLELNLKLHL